MTSTPTSTLIVSIVIALFCCQPLGIVSVVFSALAMSAESSGDFGTAQRHVGTANTLNMLGLLLWVVLVGVLCCGAFLGALGG